MTVDEMIKKLREYDGKLEVVIDVDGDVYSPDKLDVMVFTDGEGSVECLLLGQEAFRWKMENGVWKFFYIQNRSVQSVTFIAVIDGRHNVLCPELLWSYSGVGQEQVWSKSGLTLYSMNIEY